ncbi:chitin deacetylase 7-like [Ischnura elegans]|uniref:chitin deacetylase 7-like n=1 Tax=Ischnura elegans TaxID=197161 RepID=UPI001ED8B244|nr:chitin deacetylase 7-like [Ischnura elegans]
MGRLAFVPQLLALILVLQALPSHSLPKGSAKELCNESKCKPPACRCSGTDIPGNLAAKDVPQMVLLTFDDAITRLLYNTYYKNILFNRTNPNNCNISTTFFTTHEYNDYGATNWLYQQGHEIALHSITHQPGTDYWKDASVDTLTKEFIGQREILKQFALIPEKDMKGMRTPFLQMAGDNTYQMITENNLEWDCSWPTSQFSDPPMWPYTLDYTSQQDCPIPPCPVSKFPGKWVVPMVDWSNDDGIPCSMVDTCPMIDDPVELFAFIKQNFHRHYDSNRAPFPFFIHAAWFAALPMRFDVYVQFLDYLESLPDVYIVSVSQMLEWVKNPTELSKLKDLWKCWSIPETNCARPRNCELIRQDNGETRYMTSCTTCPQVYPWLGNPSGTSS